MLAFIHPDDARLLENSCVCLLGREAKSRLFEARVLAPDGNWTWMEVQLRDLLDVQAGRPCCDEEEVLHIFGHETQVLMELRSAVQTR